MQEPFELPEAVADWKPRIGVVLGSGLGSFVDAIGQAEEIDYGEFSGLPQSAVPGHAGRFVHGQVGGSDLLVAQGRVHLYEGWSAAEVTAGVRAMTAMGVRTLILTNAAGAVNTEFNVGEWMMLSDHLNLTGTTPLWGGPNFHDMSEVYSARWRTHLRGVAGRRSMVLREGVYAGMPGPQYETPAEVRMLQGIGADAVGMSTVLEAIQARALGLEVVGFSCLTNAAAGLGSSELDHSEVLESGQAAAAQMVELLGAALEDEDYSRERGSR